MDPTVPASPDCRLPKALIPVFPLRNPHLQTILASLKIRAMGKNPLRSRSVETLVDAMNGVRLLGYRTGHSKGRGLVILIHGWEGSADSTYMLTTGRRLYLSGYDVFRLNLRDHGFSHHLNEGVFHSARIDEVFSAVMNLVTEADSQPCHLIGFSLGGNFCMRIALRLHALNRGSLANIVAISPVLDPMKATVAIDTGFFVYRDYFVKKWKRSLARKQQAFPQRYDFTDILRMSTCMEMTERLIPRHTPFRNVGDYFMTYTLTDADFSMCPVPVTILTAEDDPVIPVGDFRTLRGNGTLRLIIERYGGHCGFLQNLLFEVWFEELLDSILNGNRACATHSPADAQPAGLR